MLSVSLRDGTFGATFHTVQFRFNKQALKLHAMRSRIWVISGRAVIRPQWAPHAAYCFGTTIWVAPAMQAAAYDPVQRALRADFEVAVDSPSALFRQTFGKGEMEFGSLTVKSGLSFLKPYRLL